MVPTALEGAVIEGDAIRPGGLLRCCRLYIQALKEPSYVGQLIICPKCTGQMRYCDLTCPKCATAEPFLDQTLPREKVPAWHWVPK
jgi:hypothetical protein